MYIRPEADPAAKSEPLGERDRLLVTSGGCRRAASEEVDEVDPL
jgi:hypothetical protein